MLHLNRASYPTNETSLKEIKKVINQLKLIKAADPDNLLPEIFKMRAAYMANQLYPLFKDIWDKEKIPAS